MDIRDAQLVILGNKLYVGGGSGDTSDTTSTILIYDITRDLWGSIRSPTKYSALAAYLNHLVLAGGNVVDETTNRLWSLQDDGQTFISTLPPMPTARMGAIAVSTGSHLIVMGEWTGTIITIVALMWWKSTMVSSG